MLQQRLDIGLIYIGKTKSIFPPVLLRGVHSAQLFGKAVGRARHQIVAPAWH